MMNAYQIMNVTTIPSAGTQTPFTKGQTRRYVWSCTVKKQDMFLDGV